MTKQTFTIPEGCKAITVEQVGNQLVTTFEVEFKRGDVLISKKDNYVVCVFDKIINGDCAVEIIGIIGGKITFQEDFKYFDYASNLRHATPEESQLLWDALAKEGKRWNPETMEVEEIKKDRWRAEKGKEYYLLNSHMDIRTYTEAHDNTDNKCYEAGNYFRTKEQAERAKSYIQKAIDEFWQEELK